MAAELNLCRRSRGMHIQHNVGGMLQFACADGPVQGSAREWGVISAQRGRGGVAADGVEAEQ
eukprot:4824076-Pleurochrysis_carterae.AAC.2